MTFDPGDGSGPAPGEDLIDLGGFGQATVSHTYAKTGTYSVRTCVEDDGGAQHCEQGQVVVKSSGSSDPDPGDGDPGDDGGPGADGGPGDDGAPGGNVEEDQGVSDPMRDAWPRDLPSPDFRDVPEIGREPRRARVCQAV